MARCYYEVLEVERTCSETDLKAAFRKKAMAHHPDRNDGCTDAEARFKEVNEAYSILSDPQKRAAYDRFGHAGVNGQGQVSAGGWPGGQGFGDIHDIFNEVFGDAFGDMFGGGRRQAGPQRGQDLRYDLGKSPSSRPYSGAEVEISGPRRLTLRALPGLRLQGRLQAGHLHHLRRRRARARGPGLLRHRAHLPALRRPGPDDHRSLPGLPRQRHDPPAAHPAGAHPAGRGRRRAHPPVGRGRRGLSQWPAR